MQFPFPVRSEDIGISISHLSDYGNTSILAYHYVKLQIAIRMGINIGLLVFYYCREFVNVDLFIFLAEESARKVAGCDVHS